MLREHAQIFDRIFRIGDIIIVIVSFVTAVWWYDVGQNRSLTPISSILSLGAMKLLVYIFTYVYAASHWNVYSSKRVTPTSKDVADLIKVSSIALSAMLIASIGLKLPTNGVNQVIFFWVLSTVLLASSRIFLRRGLRFVRAKGLNYRNIVVVGMNSRSASIIKAISRQEEFGLKIIGYVDESTETAKEIELDETITYLGNCDALRSILIANIVDEVFVALPVKSFYGKIDDIVNLCVERGTRVRIVSDMFTSKQAKTRSSVDMLDNTPVLNISGGPDSFVALFSKRCLDVLLSSLLLVTSAPILAVGSVLIKFDSKGPVFFAQERVGYNNRRFRLFKLRTMIKGAENMKSELADMNEMDGPVFKIRNDPRVTRAGKWLRRFSVDELPQLLNVLKGEMSLVGPRPPLPEEIEEYSWKQRRRLSSRPGMTGLWQISGRNRIPFDRWVQLDLEYIDNWTLWLDFKIILKTVFIVLSRRGAM
jgi:exopolysaccharide biosynthesis polyprenyl glycosylphosphotransferase